ncbi:MAG: acyltransferase family protein [Bacilli bacterium]
MEKKERMIGLDILRIASMLGIIGLHLIGQGGVLNNLNLMNYRTFVILFIYAICYLSVDVFGILSGYLSWKKKKINYTRIVELIIITFFHCFIITFIFYYFNLYDFKTLGLKEIINSIFPALIGRNWYITSYIFVFFMMPYSNHLIEKLEQKSMKNMLITLFIMLCIIPNIFWQTDFFKASNGYSPLWLLYCYLLGGYLGKYRLSKKINKKRITIVTSCIILAYVSNILVRIITFKIYGQVLYESWFINYVSPFNVIASLLLIPIFSNIKINNISLNKLIVFLSVSSFAVYIIHCHYLVYDYFLLNIMKFCIERNVIVIVLYFVLFGLAIYSVCSIIDFLRVKIFKIFKIDNLVNKIGKKLNDLLN